MSARSQRPALDRFRLAAAVLVVCIHTGPLSSVSGVPTTFFFDSEGAYLGGIVGAAEKSDWEEIIHGLLEE